MNKYSLKMIKSLLMVFVMVLLLSTVVYAEGSKELVASNNGYRPYTEYDSALMSGITRQTVLSVYAEEGEVICLGTSQCESYDNNDIVITNPSGGVTNINVEIPYRATLLRDWEYKTGHIATKAMESNGPNYGNIANSRGYTPYVYNAEQTGIYTVAFHGKDSEGNNNNPDDSQLNREGEFQPTYRGYGSLGGIIRKDDDNTAATVAAWDISVFKNGIYTPGRVFTKHLSLNTGAGGRSIYSNVYAVTQDGYEYKVDLNGIDPFGFILYGNNRGLIDGTSRMTLYKNAVAGATGEGNVMLNLLGNVLAPRPDQTDVGKNLTHRIFFNKPDVAMGKIMNITPQPTATFNIESIERNEGGAGFTAKVNFSKACTYTMIVDINENGVCDPEEDIDIRDAAAKGVNEIIWNGIGPDGKIVNQQHVNIIIYVKGGEIHFPFIDVENNNNGIKVSLENGEGIISRNNKYALHYDNRSYTSADNTVIPMTGGSMGDKDYYIDEAKPSPSGYVNSENGAGWYRDDYGNEKIIDYWTYVRGYDDENEAIANTGVYVASDKIYDKVFHFEEGFEIIPPTELTGTITGRVFYDTGRDGQYGTEDVPFNVPLDVYVISQFNNAQVQFKTETSPTEGRFYVSIPVNNEITEVEEKTDYSVYVIIPDVVPDDALLVTTKDTSKALIRINENNEFLEEITDLSGFTKDDPTIKRAIKLTGSFIDSEYINEQATLINKNVLIGLTLDEEPDLEVNLSVDKDSWVLRGNEEDYITYTLTLTNRSLLSDATGVIVSMPQLSNHTLVNYECENGSFTNPEWNIGTVPPTQVYTLKATYKVSGAGEYTAKADITRAFNEAGNIEGNDEEKANNSTSAVYKAYEALFEVENAIKTNNNNVLTVGKFNKADGDEAIIAKYNINSIGFVVTKNIEDLKKGVKDFNVDSVFYAECNEMYNTIYDTEGYTDEELPKKSEVKVALDEDRYYGAAVFEGMVEELNNSPYYIQGVTKFNNSDELIRENKIHSITMESGEVKLNEIN